MENYQLVFGQFLGNFKINGKLWENDFRLILLKKISENCRQTVGECSEYFCFCHLINY